ncbi:hypothetical protein ATCC90586_001870 [Pythium insidiosum]|nr:hypothetical protein ATCC90586_001870 [Pythium insidiosum]
MSSPASDARPMTNEELLAHQLEMHRRIQQQMQLQMEMSLQLGQRSSLSSSIAKVDPDLGDNVFDMLDDLIAVAPERASMSKLPVQVDSDPTETRDSLADIMESLDMDLDDFDIVTVEPDSTRESISELHEFDDATFFDEERDSFDDIELEDADADEEIDHRLSGEMIDHGVDDDVDIDDTDPASNPFAVLKDPNEHAVPDDFVGRQRLSSSDMLASMASSMSSVSMNGPGNMCALVWEGGLLGIRLRMSQSKMLPVVSKLTGRSSIAGIHLVDVGDLLLEIGDRSTRDMEFTEAINYLKEAPKPCKLVFRRISADPMVVKPVQPPVKSALALRLAKKFEELGAQEEEKQTTAPLVKLEEKFEVKWLDGPLGISLIASKDVPYPLVTRITGKNRSPQVEDVQPGHYLVQIGTYNTSDGNFNTAIKYLQKVSKPVSLYFCPGNKKASTRPEAADDEYDQIWEKKQPLAFTVRPNDHGRMSIADLGSAKSVKVKGKGPGLNLSMNTGDIITWINDESTEDLSFHEALHKLRTAKRPLVVRFKKAPPEPPADLRIPAPMLTVAPSPTHAAVPAQEPSGASTPSKSQGASRSFNPLKKIAALGSHAKENSLNVLNQRSHQNATSHEARRPSAPSSSAATVPKKQVSSDATSKHEHVSSSTKSTVSHSSHASTSDTIATDSRRTEQGSKLINLDALNGFRKPMVTKSSSDPNLNKPADHPPVAPAPSSHPVRLTRNSGSRPVEDAANPTDSDEYEVIWPEGTALGLSLRVHPSTRFPMVARLTGTSNLKNIEHVKPGDVLFAANGAPIVPQAKFKHTLEYLSKLPKPATLRFRRGTPVDDADAVLPRGPPLKDYEYELIWRENTNLGLVFSSDGDVPRVTKVDAESGGPSVMIVHVGDSLTHIGPMDIHGSSFHASMATLRAVKRPVVLRFKRRLGQAP